MSYNLHYSLTKSTTLVVAERLELTELLAHVDWLGLGRGLDLEHVEAHGLGERAALADGHDVTLLDAERWRHVGRDVLVALLETLVLLHEVQVVATHDDRALHLGREHDALEDTAADRDVAGEWALLVHVLALDGRLWGLEAEANFLVEAWAGLLAGELLAGKEDAILLLVSLFVL